MHLFLALFFVLFAAQASALTVSVTGSVTSVTIHDSNTGSTSFSGDDARLDGWWGAGMLTTEGSMELYEIDWGPGDVEVRARNCSGLLALFCGGIAYNIDMEDWAVADWDCRSCRIDSSLGGFTFTDDSDEGWSNASGVYDYNNGVTVSIFFQGGKGPLNQRAAAQALVETPLPASAWLFLSAAGALWGLKRKSKAA